MLQNTAFTGHGGLIHVQTGWTLLWHYPHGAWKLVPVGSLSWHFGGARPKEQKGKYVLSGLQVRRAAGG